jgi:hypothetical protein
MSAPLLIQQFKIQTRTPSHLNRGNRKWRQGTHLLINRRHTIELGRCVAAPVKGHHHRVFEPRRLKPERRLFHLLGSTPFPTLAGHKPRVLGHAQERAIRAALHRLHRRPVEVKSRQFGERGDVGAKSWLSVAALQRWVIAILKKKSITNYITNYFYAK